MTLVLQDQLVLKSGGGSGGGKVDDVKVDGVSVLDESDKTAYIDLTGKVDKTNIANQIYGTSTADTQTTLTYDESYAANTIAQRDANSQLNVNLTPTADNNATSKHYVDDRVDAAIAEAVVFKGVVEDQTELPATGNVNGDMYWIRAFVDPVPTGMTEGRSGAAIYKGAPDNQFYYTEDSIYQPDEQTIDFNGNGQLAVQISADTGNVLVSKNDGLYVEEGGKVEDVQVDGTSILVNKIADLGTMALEEANDYGVVFRVWSSNE